MNTETRYEDSHFDEVVECPEDCEYCEEDRYWSVTEDPEHFGKAGNNFNPCWFPKFIADGQSDLNTVADIYEWMAADMREKASHGWVLSQEVDNGHIFTHWAGEGDPPKTDSYSSELSNGEPA